MPNEVNVKLHFQRILPALLGIAAAAVGIFCVGALGDYFARNPFFVPVKVASSVGIDVFGAIAPLAVSFVSAALFLGYFKFSAKKLVLALVLSVLLAFPFSHLTDNGVMSSPLLFAFVSSMIAFAVNVLPKPFTDTQKKYVASMLLAVCCVPVALFAVDLFYLPHFDIAIIGGNGMCDGVLISTLYAPLSVTLLTSIVVYVSRTVWLVGEQRRGSKTNLPPLKPNLLSAQTDNADEAVKL
jgi:hypothetical protein